MKNEPPLYDVVVIDKDRAVTSVIASRTLLNDGYYSAIRWKNTWQSRTTRTGEAAVVIHGAFKLGDKVHTDQEILG